MTDAYLRYPHVHGDLLAFVAADDVWLAPTQGGRAWRLTDDRVPVRSPRLSPDGAHLAFVSHRDGHPEVMVTGVTGGGAERLTWWGAEATLVLGWTADGRVLAASHAGEANLRHLVVRAVSLDGAVERLDYGPAWGVAEHPGGAVALSTPGSRPPAHWKRYRGGTAPRLWLDATGDRSWQQLLTDEPASLVDPMWLGDALAFVSDRAAVLPEHADEQADLWIWDRPGTGSPRRLTAQGPRHGYVRDATTDGQRVVWHSRGDLWLLDGPDGQPDRVDLELPGSRTRRFAARPTANLDVLAPDHRGDASLVGWRGAAFWLTHREGPARALAADPGVRVREPALLGSTGDAVVVSDAQGEDALDILSTTGAAPDRLMATGRLGRVLHLAPDPAGEQVATVSHDGRISLVRVSDGSIREIGRSTQGEARSLSFSPDGRYLVWSQPTTGEAELHQLMVADLAASAGPAALTSGRFHDHSPVITRDGKFVAFLSDRTFDPSYDTHEFALSFSGSTRPWLIPLAATEPAPFGPSVDGWRISTQPADRPGGPGEGAGAGTAGERHTPSAEPTPPPSPDIDLAGAEERIVPFPVPSGKYRRVQAVPDGVLWIHESADAGEIGSRRAGVSGDPAPDTLELWSFARRRVETLADAVDSFAVSGDGARVVVRAKDEVIVLPSGRALEEEDQDENPQRVEVDLDRLRLEVDPAAEWAQMFEENARIMRDHFWRADMDGVDWDAVVTRWRPVVAALRSHDDLVDLLWEVGGELGTSHAYVMPVEPAGDRTRRLGLLGADLSPAEGGWVLERILPGESSDPAARSPLRAAGVDARTGDVVVAVDGLPVDHRFGPATRLVGAADTPVELTLRRDGRDRRVVVVPLPDEQVLRYQDWVRSRRAYVQDRSGGRLGYLHIPDMMSHGWAQLHRDLRQATRAEGLIADVRYNRGGHTSQLVVARLAARVVAWSTGRHYAEPGTYPSAAPRGPVVLVANENSGSDGDIVNAAAQAMGVGPVVGVRTWGGVVGIDGRFDLVDGTRITQPRYSYWLQGKGWGVENHGVDPDVEVVHSPADFFGEADPQLDRAMAEAFALLERHPAAEPPSLPEPKVRPATG